MEAWLPWPALAAVAVSLIACSSAVAWAWLRPQSVVDHTRVVLAATAVLSLLALAALLRTDPLGLRLRLDPSEEPMIARGDPARAVYDEAVRAFGDDDVFIVGMQVLGCRAAGAPQAGETSAAATGGSPATRAAQGDLGPAAAARAGEAHAGEAHVGEAHAGEAHVEGDAAARCPDVFSREQLATLRSVGQEIRALPGVRSIESLTDTTEFRYAPERDRIEVDDFMDEIPSDGAHLAELRRRALADAIYTRGLVAADGRSAAVNVSFVPMTDGEFVEAGIDPAIRAILAKHGDPSRRFFITGRKHIKAQAHAIMVHDLLTLIPLAMLAGSLVAWWMTGSIASGFLPVGVSLVATLWVLGLMCALSIPLNIITIVLGPMLICVGSVYGVHVYARFEEFAASSGSPQEAAATCITYTRLPVLIAGLTTCFGFGALLLSDTPAVQELGLYAASGTAAVTAIALTAFPVLLTLLPRAPVLAHSRDRLDRLLGVIARVATGRPGAVLTACGAVTLLAVVLIPKIVVDTDYVSFFDPYSRVRRDFDSVSELLVGAMPIYVTLDGHEEGSFREPADLRMLERLQHEVDAIEGVSATLSVVDFLKQLNRAFEDGDPRAARIPETRGEVAELLFLIPKDRLRRFADSNHSRVNLLVRTGWSGSAKIRRLEDRLAAAVADAGLPAGMDYSVTGKTVLVNHVADGIAATQFRSVGAATLTILLLVTWAFRSWRFGAIAMVPNIVPILIYFGILGAGVATMSLPTSLIGCIALGIAVDDTAHFVVAYRGRRAEGMDPAAAAAGSIGRLGRPIVVTSVMLMAGFLVFQISGFATLRELGALLALTMLLCLSADLLLLSAVLVRTRA